MTSIESLRSKPGSIITSIQKATRVTNGIITIMLVVKLGYLSSALSRYIIKRDGDIVPFLKLHCRSSVEFEGL